MEQVAELVALIDVHVEASLLVQPALLVLDVGVDGANKVAVAALGMVFAVHRWEPILTPCCLTFIGQFDDAAIKQQLNVPAKLRKLLYHEVLLAHKFFEFSVVDRSEIEVCRV